MSNLEAYPTRESEATVRAGIANRVRHAGIAVAGMSLLSGVAEVGYRVVEQLPDPTEVNTEVKGSAIVFTVSAVTALGSALYETVVRHRHSINAQDLIENKLAILSPTER